MHLRQQTLPSCRLDLEAMNSQQWACAVELITGPQYHSSLRLACRICSFFAPLPCFILEVVTHLAVYCRQSLKREGSGPVAAAGDGLELQSRVRLLDGPFYEGQYMIGSVNFVKAAGSDNPEADEGA